MDIIEWDCSGFVYDLDHELSRWYCISGDWGSDIVILSLGGEFPRLCSPESSTADLSAPSDLSRGGNRSSLASRLSVHLFNQV